MIKNWNIGIVEHWNIGLRRKWFSHYSNIPMFHHSIFHFKEIFHGTGKDGGRNDEDRRER